MSYILILIVLLVALFGLCKEYVPKRLRAWIVGGIVAFLLVGAGIQIYLEYSRAKKEWQRRWSGKLQSPVKSTAKFPVLTLGTSRLVWKGEPVKPVFNLVGEPIFLRLEDGEAKLSVVIRDKTGLVLAAITDNEWFVASSKAMDRNFNQNSLEVRDSKGQVVFQVQLEGEEVRLAGRFYAIDGKGPVVFLPWLHDLEGRKDSLFRYPSAEHPGERAPKE